MVTIKDVAKHARVSPMTVSRVVSGKGTVSDELRERVVDSIVALGYVYNTSASRLRTASQDSRVIGLILRDVSSPFSAELQRSIEDELHSSSSLVLTASNDDNLQRTEHLVRTMLGARADALVIAPPPGDQEYLVDLLQRGLRVVLVDRPGPKIDASSVISENFKGMEDAAIHLAKRGHRRIAYFGNTDSVPLKERLDGFLSGLKKCGVDPSELIMALDITTSEQSETRARQLLASDSPPTAFIGGFDMLTIGIVSALHEKGAQDRVALIGFDDLELAPNLNPGLTVIAQNPVLVGKSLVKLINRPDNKTRSITVPTTLIPRGSGEIPPTSRSPK